MSLVIISGAPGVGKKTLQEIALDQLRGSKPVTAFELKGFESSAIGEISRQAGKTSVILRTPLAQKTKSGIAAIPQKTMDSLKPKLIIMVEADPQEISQRQLEEERMDVNEIGFMQDYSRSIASAYSVLKGIPVKVIFNRKNKIRDAAFELEEALKDVF
ncbi:MAG: AAA family ATPase [Candidatus Aenigmatarchaeota archaeon]